MKTTVENVEKTGIRNLVTHAARYRPRRSEIEGIDVSQHAAYDNGVRFQSLDSCLPRLETPFVPQGVTEVSRRCHAVATLWDGRGGRGINPQGCHQVFQPHEVVGVPAVWLGVLVLGHFLTCWQRRFEYCSCLKVVCVKALFRWAFT